MTTLKRSAEEDALIVGNPPTKSIRNAPSTTKSIGNVPITTKSINLVQCELTIGMLKKILAKSNSSTMFSPNSLAIALGMGLAGTGGQTEQEMCSVLAGDASQDNVHHYFGELLKLLAVGDKGFTLESANKIYVKEEFPLLPDFTDVLTEKYEGQFEAVDFLADAAQKINSFVESTTHGKIQDMVQDSSFNEDTRMVLINAAYFKGVWKTQFLPRRTLPKPFYVTKEKSRELEMMRTVDEINVPYLETEEWQVVALPYESGSGLDVSMYVLLPIEKCGLDGLLAKMEGAELQNLLQKTHCAFTPTIVSLPKFKIETTHQLIPMLQSNGMREAFDSEKADFSKMATERLFISNILQKAFIEVNEEGTEAAAATMFEYECCSGFDMPDPEPHVFNADHPFLYCIVIKEEGTEWVEGRKKEVDKHILFAGVFK